MGLPASEIAPLIAGLPSVRSYTAAQLEQWIFIRKVGSFDEMSNLPRDLRSTLVERFRIDPLEVETTSWGDDGSTKFLFRLADGAKIESVEIPVGDSDDERTTFCISSQAGCAADCVFCVTGRIGPGRNLTAGEIVGQYVTMMRGRHVAERERINVVFMGMGEPTANLANVRKAFDQFATEISPRHITLSTVGQVPGVEEIASWPSRPNLAVSINAADDELRSRLMPVNRAHGLSSLRSALLGFPLERGRRITAEYVLIEGVNDQPLQARKLADFLRGIPSKVNLIPLNEDPTWLPGLHRPDEQAIDAFCEILVSRGLTVTVRRSRGSSTSAACGQLKGRSEPARTSRSAAEFEASRPAPTSRREESKGRSRPGRR